MCLPLHWETDKPEVNLKLEAEIDINSKKYDEGVLREALGKLTNDKIELHTERVCTLTVVTFSFACYDMSRDEFRAALPEGYNIDHFEIYED